MTTLFKWLIYAVSAGISIKFADGYWVVGPVFGLSVTAWDSNLFRNFDGRRHGTFLISSTLIYALVYWVAMRKWESQFEEVNYFFGPFPLGVVLGSVLLPLAHALIFKNAQARIKRTIISLAACFYVVMFFAYLGNRFWPENHFNFVAVAIALWQGIYLFSFRSSK